MSVDLEALFVDDDVMVEPAEGDEIVGIGGSALTPGDDVVDLESVVTGTAVSGAGVGVAVEDGPA
jgi:hypothetical protein